MERFGSELEFISRISADGKKIEVLNETEKGKTSSLLKKDVFKLSCLSISNLTFIASGMNSYVVKLKNPPR